MAVRHATRRYPDFVAYLEDWQSSLQLGMILLPAGTISGEPAKEMTVDFVLPSGKRVDRVPGQLVNRFPDGSVALRMGSVPDLLEAAGAESQALLERVRAYLVASGQLGTTSAAEVETLGARVAQLEKQLADTDAARLAALRAVAQAAGGGGGGGAARSAGGGEPTVGPAGRGYALPDLSGPAARAGTLSDYSLRDTLMQVAVAKSNGVFTFTYPDGATRWGFWHKGGTVGWRSAPVREDEVLGVLLFRANQITKEQLAQSVTLMEQRNCRQGEALIELGLLTFAQLVLLLQKQAEFVLQRVLADKTGSWTWHEVPELPERFVAPPVRVAAVLFRALRQRAKDMASDTLADILQPHLDTYVFIKPGVERTFEEMRLSAEETGFLKIIGATSYRLREVPSVSNLTRSSTASMVWCLDELGLIEFRAQEAEKRGQDRVSRSLLSKKAVVQKGTLFERLDLHWICTAREVEIAWRRTEEEFPASNPDKYGPEWRDTCLLIRKGVEEAYQRLKGDAGRREYRSSVIEKAMIDQSAAMLAGKGDMAVIKAQAREAWDCFSKAVELNPGAPEYKSGLAKAEAAGGRPV